MSLWRKKEGPTFSGIIITKTLAPTKKHSLSLQTTSFVLFAIFFAFYKYVYSLLPLVGYENKRPFIQSINSFFVSLHYAHQIIIKTLKQMTKILAFIWFTFSRNTNINRSHIDIKDVKWVLGYTSPTLQREGQYGNVNLASTA